MIALKNFNGMLSIHMCFYCKSWIVIPPQYARVGHFRVEVKNGTFTRSTSLEVYSSRLRSELKSSVEVVSLF